MTLADKLQAKHQASGAVQATTPPDAATSQAEPPTDDNTQTGDTPAATYTPSHPSRQQGGSRQRKRG